MQFEQQKEKSQVESQGSARKEKAKLAGESNEFGIEETHGDHTSTKNTLSMENVEQHEFEEEETGKQEGKESPEKHKNLRTYY